MFRNACKLVFYYGGTSFLQSLDYAYNIWAWLTHINNEAMSNDGVINDDANDIFGMQLVYESSNRCSNCSG